MQLALLKRGLKWKATSARGFTLLPHCKSTWNLWRKRQATWGPRPADTWPTQGPQRSRTSTSKYRPPCKRAGPGVPSSANGVEVFTENYRKRPQQLTSVFCPPHPFPPKLHMDPGSYTNNVRTRVPASRNREKEDITLGPRVRAQRGSRLTAPWPALQLSGLSPLRVAFASYLNHCYSGVSHTEPSPTPADTASPRFCAHGKHYIKPPGTGLKRCCGKVTL